MRRLLFSSILLVAPVVAQEEGEKVVDKSGLVVQVPDKWSRDSAREKGSVKFAGLYDLTKTKYVLFSVEAGPAKGYDEATWLGNEKASATKALQSVDTPWTTEPITVGGQRAVRYTIGGKASADKNPDLRLRACAVVMGDTCFRISEISYNRAHDEAADALRAMWEAVKFEEPNPFGQEEKKEGCGEEGGKDEGSSDEDPSGEGGSMGTETPKGEPLPIEDKAGNFKLNALPGWSMNRAPPDDEAAEVRLTLVRSQESGGLGELYVARRREDNAEVFATTEAGDYLVQLAERGFFEPWYEEGSAKVIRPQIDVRTQLGGAEKSCAFELRGVTMSEDAKIEEAKKLIARGDKTAVVPEFKPIVIRGRIAMISPYIYITWSILGGETRGPGDDETLVGEVKQMLDSLEFSSTEGKPPPLGNGDQPLGNTVADAANKTERKKSKVQEYKKGAKVAAALKLDYVLPPGFQEMEKVLDTDAQKLYGGEDLALLVAAQDDNNGWVFITVITACSKRLGSNEHFEDKKKIFDGWIHNFESLARGAGKMPLKATDVAFGNLRGDGCELKGKINNFSATEIHMVTDEAGWRIEIMIKTRGAGAKTFAKEIDAFRKRFRVSKK